MFSGGYYIQIVPKWLEWAKYTSLFMYGFGSVSRIIVAQFPEIPYVSFPTTFKDCRLVLVHVCSAITNIVMNLVVIRKLYS